jgi:hypothetical protein
MTARRGNVPPKRNKIPGAFVAVTFEMMNSAAYRKICGSALKALLLCLRKVKTYDDIDRYSQYFTLTHPEAQKQGLWPSAFNRGIKQLVEVGFIDIVSRGGMRCEGKACSYYRLSKRWKKYGTPEFQERRYRGYAEDVHGVGVKG